MKKLYITFFEDFGVWNVTNDSYMQTLEIAKHMAKGENRVHVCVMYKTLDGIYDIEDEQYISVGNVPSNMFSADWIEHVFKIANIGI